MFSIRVKKYDEEALVLAYHIHFQKKHCDGQQRQLDALKMAAVTVATAIFHIQFMALQCNGKAHLIFTPWQH